MKTKTFKNSPIFEDLKNPEFASLYLESALEEDMNSFIIALRNISDARGGLGSLSKITKLGRESLYKTLSSEGDSRPYFSTILQILNAMDLKFTVASNAKRKSSSK